MRAIAFAFVFSSWPAFADFAGLRERVAQDLRAGKPLTIEAHVALCDNGVIRCGGRGLGDGDDLKRNLYWATSGGLRGWFERPGSGWTRVSLAGGDGRILETVIYSRRESPSEAWRALGVREPFEVRVVAHAWRGREIDRALDAFANDLFSDESPQIIAWVGHNGWMDRETQHWPRGGARRVKGAIAIACLTKSYLRETLLGETRVPLLLTRDLLFAGSHALDGAVQAFVAGGTLEEIRMGAARAYAGGEGKSVTRVQNAFTN
jgi:hypothetical protein